MLLSECKFADSAAEIHDLNGPYNENITQGYNVEGMGAVRQ